VTNFIAISYFGQTIMVWYLHLAAIASLYAATRGGAPQAVANRRTPAAPAGRSVRLFTRPGAATRASAGAAS
jgi:hypothetical protein